MKMSKSVIFRVCLKSKFKKNKKMSVILKTSRVSQLKIIFDTIKDLIQDVNIHFIEDSLPDAGMIIAHMDNSKCALVQFFMTKEEISKVGVYKCSQRCSAGINISQFHKFLKTVKDQDTLTIRVDPAVPEKLILKYENEEKKKQGQFDINLLDIDEEELELPAEEFESIITLDSSEFQQMCRDLNCVETDKVSIASTGTQFIMSAEGDPGRGTLRLGEKQGTSFENETKFKGIISNVYPLRFLICFAKAYKLSTTVRIRLKQNYPVVIDYHIPSVGLLRFCLCNIDKSELKGGSKVIEEKEIESMPEFSKTNISPRKKRRATSSEQAYPRKKLKTEKECPVPIVPTMTDWKTRERRSVRPPPII